MGQYTISVDEMVDMLRDDAFMGDTDSQEALEVLKELGYIK